MEEKMDAITTAINSLNITLEGKLALIEAAVKNQTLKQEEMAGKLITAIDNLKGSMEEKMDAITTAINSLNTSLEGKLALIEAAIKAQTLSVAGKLGLIETAIKNLPDYSAQLTAIKAAIESLPDYGGKLDALINAIKALPNYTAQLEAIKAAIEALPDYGSKLTALENAIKALPNYNDKFDAVVAALGAMKTQIEALGTGQTAIATQIGNTVAAINNLIAAVNSGNTDATAALTQIIAKLEELKAAIEAIETGGGTPPEEEYVDLGLSVKWAKRNLGASKPSDYGYYYAWGETEPKAEYTWENYKWGKVGNQTKYNKTDGKTTLDPEDDAATAKLGSPWRMPTSAEIQELLKNCTWTWTTQDGKNGYEVKGPNGNSIFLPATGSYLDSGFNGAGSRGPYWSVSIRWDDLDFADSIRFDSYTPYFGNTHRSYGLPVRPVRQ